MNYLVGFSILEMARLKTSQDNDAFFSEKKMVKI